LEALAVKIKVPSNRLPNSQAYQSLIKTAQERLISVTIKQLMESGIVNTAYARGLDFRSPTATEDSVFHLATLIARHVEQQYPYVNLVKNGMNYAIRGGSTGVGVGIQFVFKDRDGIFTSLSQSVSRDLDEGSASNSEIAYYGVPRWLNRYIAKINRLCVEKRIPGSVSLSVAQYSPIVNGLLSSKATDRAHVKVTIHFDPVILVPSPSHDSNSWTKSYGKFGRGKNVYNSNIGHLCIAKSVQESMGGAKMPANALSYPLYSLAFFAKDMVQIIKTLHRKAEYVPSVFAVKV
jgi:hypothetical protein